MLAIGHDSEIILQLDSWSSRLPKEVLYKRAEKGVFDFLLHVLGRQSCISVTGCSSGQTQSVNIVMQNKTFFDETHYSKVLLKLRILTIFHVLTFGKLCSAHACTAMLTRKKTAACC